MRLVVRPIPRFCFFAARRRGGVGLAPLRRRVKDVSSLVSFRVSFRVRRRSFRVLVARRSFHARFVHGPPRRRSLALASRLRAESLALADAPLPRRFRGSLPGGKGLAAVGSRRRRRRDALARALLLLRGLRFRSRVGSSRGQRGKGSRVTARDRVDGRKRRRERRREEDSRGKTDCRRVASGTHHALVIARLPIGIGHPCAHAGLVYVRKRLEAGPRPSSRLPRARTRPARRFPGGSAAGKARAPACRNP